MSLLRTSIAGLAVGSFLVGTGPLLALAEESGGVSSSDSPTPTLFTGTEKPENSLPPVPPKRPPVITSSSPQFRDKMEGKNDTRPLSTSTKIRMMEEMRKNASSSEGHQGIAPCAATNSDRSPCSEGKGPGERKMGSTTPNKLPINVLMKREMEMRERLLHATSTASSTRPSIKVREEWKKDWQNTASSTKERVKEKVMIDVKNVTKKLTDAIENLTNISDRVQSRADKLAAKGADVTIATGALADAKGALDAAKTDLQTVITNLNIVINSANPRDDFTKVQDSVNKVKADIKTAHASLQKAVNALKEANASLEATGTDASDHSDN